MKTPLDTPAGTIISGVALTVILIMLVRLIVQVTGG